MPGHGQIIATAEAQGDLVADVSNTDGATEYQTGQNTLTNNTGQSLKEGDVVITAWDSSAGCVCADDIGTRATGDVNSKGTTLTITSSGDTDLEGTVEINTSGTYGSNSGYARASVT